MKFDSRSFSVHRRFETFNQHTANLVIKHLFVLSKSGDTRGCFGRRCAPSKTNEEMPKCFLHRLNSKYTNALHVESYTAQFRLTACQKRFIYTYKILNSYVNLLVVISL